ncbi:MFS transporter [Nocardiopsis composta]
MALPSIAADTGAGLAPLQWAVNGFNVAFACCTLAWGSIADVTGRVRAFALGAGIFAAASLGSAFAGDVYLLDAARAAAGIGGAAVLACGSAILSTAFAGPARARAFALFGTVAGVGLAAGPSLSGLIVDTAGWRWVFGGHALVMAVVLAAVPVIARGTPPAERTGARIDLPGTLLFVAAMLLLTTGIVQGAQWGWTGPGVLALFAGAAVALAVFAAVERRRSHPMLDLALLRDARFVGLCLVPVAASFGFVTVLTYLPGHLAVVGGRSPAEAGLIMVLLTLPVVALPIPAARFAARSASPLPLIHLSLACLVVGDLGLLLSGPDTPVAVTALPMLITGAGMGLSAGLIDRLALESADPAKAGMAAGFLNTLRLGSEAIAVAVYGALLATLVGGRIRDGIGDFPGAGDPGAVAERLAGGHAEAAPTAPGGGAFADFLVAAYDGAFHTVLLVLAGVCLMLAAAVAVLLRGGLRAAAPAEEAR